MYVITASVCLRKPLSSTLLRVLQIQTAESIPKENMIGTRDGMEKEAKARMISDIYTEEDVKETPCRGDPSRRISPCVRLVLVGYV